MSQRKIKYEKTSSRNARLRHTPGHEIELASYAVNACNSFVSLSRFSATLSGRVSVSELVSLYTRVMILWFYAHAQNVDAYKWNNTSTRQLCDNTSVAWVELYYAPRSCGPVLRATRNTSSTDERQGGCMWHSGGLESPRFFRLSKNSSD